MPPRPNDILAMNVTADGARLLINTISARIAELASMLRVGQSAIRTVQEYELDKLQALKINLLGQFNIQDLPLKPESVMSTEEGR